MMAGEVFTCIGLQLPDTSPAPKRAGEVFIYTSPAPEKCINNSPATPPEKYLYTSPAPVKYLYTPAEKYLYIPPEKYLYTPVLRVKLVLVAPFFRQILMDLAVVVGWLLEKHSLLDIVSRELIITRNNQSVGCIVTSTKHSCS